MLVVAVRSLPPAAPVTPMHRHVQLPHTHLHRLIPGNSNSMLQHAHLQQPPTICCTQFFHQAISSGCFFRLFDPAVLPSYFIRLFHVAVSPSPHHSPKRIHAHIHPETRMHFPAKPVAAVQPSADSGVYSWLVCIPDLLNLLQVMLAAGLEIGSQSRHPASTSCLVRLFPLAVKSSCLIQLFHTAV